MVCVAFCPECLYTIVYFFRGPLFDGDCSGSLLFKKVGQGLIGNGYKLIPGDGISPGETPIFSSEVHIGRRYWSEWLDSTKTEGFVGMVEEKVVAQHLLNLHSNYMISMDMP